MAKWTGLIVAMTVVCALSSCAKKPADYRFKKTVKTNLEKLGYSMGLDAGRTLKFMPGDIDFASFLQGLSDAYYKRPQLLSDADARAIKDTSFKHMKEILKDKNAREGKAFLEANKKLPGVTVLPSGMQYKVVMQGTGPVPKPVDWVKASFKATTMDGTEFDGSDRRNGPVVYLVEHAMPGIREALLLMPVGSKWTLYLPPELALGERGNPPLVGPGATVIYELELLSIEPPQQTKMAVTKRK